MVALDFQCRHRYGGGFELDASFTVKQRFTALFGPSGSGKTSILSIIAGLVQPQEGSIRLNDRTLFDAAAGQCLPPAARNIGYVFQDALLFPHLTVERNLRYGQRRRRRCQRVIPRSRVVEVLEIGPLLQRYPRALSGGEKQRVALGRALLSGPEILVLDEPLAALDARLRNRILSYLETLVAEWDIPTLFVTHSQSEVRRAADWVIVLDRGRVIGSGTPEEALGQPAPLTWTNSTGPVNLLRIQGIATENGRTVARIGEQPLVLPNIAMPEKPPNFVQFRPADVILSRQDVAGLSVRNHLCGRVCQVLTLDRAVFVAVDIGQIVWAEITAEAAAELQLALGVPVICLLKAHSLTLVEQD